VIGHGKENERLHLVGLADCIQYVNEDGTHALWQEDLNHAGIENIFSSTNTHLGFGLSRRDDIESLAYMLLYLDSKGIVKVDSMLIM
jgi:hypothetical protein